VARAGAVQPAFALHERNAGDVAQLCVRLDGIPLALELAAACLRGLAVEQVVVQLDRRFRLLTRGSRTALPRQQTLQATVEWSYSLLSRAQQTLFIRLSVFAGGFALEAAEAVCAGGEILEEDVLDLLLRLIDMSMVVTEEGPTGSARYRLLETLRQYGRERLIAEGGAALLHERHAAYFLVLAEQARPALRGPDQAAWLTRLEGEHDNLRAALAWWLGTDGDAGLQLAGALWVFWFRRGHRGEGLRWLEQALGQQGTRARTRAAALHGAGFLAWYLGQGARGRAWLQESVALWREVGDQRGLADALAHLGDMTREQSYALGTALLEESMTIARTAGDPALLGWTLMLFAFHADLEQEEQRAQARSAAEEALAHLRSAGDTFAQGHAHRALARIALHEGDYPRARAGLEAAVAAVQAAGARHAAATGLGLLGDVALRQGEPQVAAAFYAQSVALWRAVGLSSDLGIDEALVPPMLRYLGDIALDQGDDHLAQTWYAQSLEVARVAGEVGQIVQTLEAQAGLAAVQDQPHRALRLAGAAACLRGDADRPQSAGEDPILMQRLAAARQALGEDEHAAAWAEGQAMTLEQAIAYALADQAR
jgi:non-specific serine/threonine protein kinase